MKNLIKITALLFISYNGTAQTGNVGIGTSSPGFPLNFAPAIGDKISLFGNEGGHYGLGIQSYLMQIHTDAPEADIAFGYGASSNFTETMRIRGNGNVGIGKSNPSSLLHLQSSDVTDVPRGDLLLSRYWASNNDTRASAVFHYFNSASVKDNLAFAVSGTGGTYDQPNQLSQIKMLIQAGGNVGIGTTSPTARLEVNGYTKLGSEASTPSIKIKKITGTTSPTEGVSIVYSLGVNATKILSVSVTVQGADAWHGPHLQGLGYHFYWAYTLSHLIVYNVYGDSVNILSKPFTALITYEE